jgi:hypothetical protein
MYKISKDVVLPCRDCAHVERVDAFNDDNDW